MQRISGQRTDMVFMSQRGPGNLLNLTSAQHMKKAERFVGDPQIPRRVLRDGKHVAAGNTAYGSEAAILQVADAAKRRDPDPPAIILKKRTGVEPVEFAVRFDAARAGNRHLALIPLVQAAISREPNAAVPVCQNRPDDVARQPLARRKRGDGKVAKAVEAIFGRYH